MINLKQNKDEIPQEFKKINPQLKTMAIIKNKIIEKYSFKNSVVIKIIYMPFLVY